ncbi:hypothetical protein B5X24_HaOG209702 [Helicoverpa armigera]|uniref:C2H2-type domain-containing protein n=1 Tax=Helicoverpa armigera TaxID=29058 RepID=A0A2W1BDN3_HELAM|nr:hypothetical protein B5X24_HaOG209702 [Helicoverpa armigera]
MRMDKNNLSIKMDITDLTCNLCQANINTIANLKDHLIKEHDKKLYTDVNDYILEFKLTDGILCAYCKTTYKDLPHLRTHLQEEHKSDSLIDNMRMDKNNLSIKMDITDLTCNLCQANINTIANLKDHLIKEHDKKLYTDVNDYILEFKLTDGTIFVKYVI